MTDTPILVDMVDPAMTADLSQVRFTMTLSDERVVTMAIPVEHLSGLTNTFLNYALVAGERRHKAGLKAEQNIRTDLPPTPATSIAFAQTPNGLGAVALVFGAAQIVVPFDSVNLRRLAMQSLALADVLDGVTPDAAPEPAAEPEAKPETDAKPA